MFVDQGAEFGARASGAEDKAKATKDRQYKRKEKKLPKKSKNNYNPGQHYLGHQG